ncbi:MAG TPA: hypothetical protein VFU14_11185 [Acidimicrobiales bacterium]|nr:hypothetical protein [Acidimicrobiales bacterium]
MPPSDDLAHLRCAAALLGCTHTVSARFVHGDRVVLEVRRPPLPPRDHAVLPPCWFRALVADAVGNGAPDDADDRRRLARLAACRIDMGVRDGTSVLAGGVVRLHCGPAWLHLLAVAAPIERVRLLAYAAVDEADGVQPGAPFELHPAGDLDVTVVALASPRAIATSEAAADVLRTIGMRVAVDRLERELPPVAHPADRGRPPAAGDR